MRGNKGDAEPPAEVPPSSARRGGVLQTIGQPFGSIYRLARSTRRDGVGDPSQLALDVGEESVRRGSHQRLEPRDGVVQSGERR